MSASRVGQNAALKGLLWGSALVLALSLTAGLPAAQAASNSLSLSVRGAPPIAELASPAAAPAIAVKPLLTPAADLVPPQVLASVNVGSAPGMAVYDSGNGYVYEANNHDNNVSVLSGTSVVASVSLETSNATVGAPTYLVYDPANGFVYVVDQVGFEVSGGAVSILDGTAVVDTVAVGVDPVAAAYDSADGFVYVTQSGPGSVAVLSGTTVVGAISVGTGSEPGAIAFDPINGYVYVANAGAGNVSELDGASVVGGTVVGTAPDALVVNPVSGAVNVLNGGSGNVTLIEGTGSVGNVATGTDPSAGAYDPANGEVYIANYGSDDVVALSGISLLGTVTVGAGPSWVAFDSGTDLVYVVNYLGDSVSVVNGASLLGNVSVGKYPMSAVWDAADNDVYVTNSDSHNVSVIAVAYPAYFNETGLPASTAWSVTLGGRTVGTSGSSLSFAVLPGSWTYSIAPPVGYRVISSTPASPVVVTSGPATVAVTFGPVSSATYDLTFVESGLTQMCMRSTEWTVTVGSESQSSDGSSIVFSEPNGTYNYTVSDAAGETIVSESPASPVTIDGAAVTVTVDFGSGHGQPTTFSLTFQEQGLPWGTTWCVNVGSTVCSTSDQIVISGLASGTYSFSVSPVAGYTANPSSGTVTISDHDQFVRIQFSNSGGHRCGGGSMVGAADRAPPAA